MIKGLFDIEFRLEDLTRNGDPLVHLNACVNWEMFRPELETIREKERKSPAGRKPFDVVMMFKVLVIQAETRRRREGARRREEGSRIMRPGTAAAYGFR